MVTVEEHYESLLSDVYTWLMGGFDEAKSNNVEFFKCRNITPLSSGIAVDLGAGSGFQSIPLAELGFNVTAIDLKILQDSFSSLEDDGKLILTFRDLSTELKDTDRFIPVRSDENIIFTCFLEYEPATVKIHDIVYIKTDGKWELNKSCYRKIRLSVEWTENQLLSIGFKIEESSNGNGFQTIVAVK